MEHRRTKLKAKRKRKEPSVIRKVIEVLHEDAMRRRAFRLLEKQAWSLDFLAAALVKAAKGRNEGLVLTITDKNGVKIELGYDDALHRHGGATIDDSVFMHLDDDLAVERFIRENSRR